MPNYVCQGTFNQCVQTMQPPNGEVTALIKGHPIGAQNDSKFHLVSYQVGDEDINFVEEITENMERQ